METTDTATREWQTRAEAAERELEQTRRRLTELDAELQTSRDAVTALERRQRIDLLLAESDAIDFEAARLLTEAAVAQMDSPDVKLAIDDLRRHRPYLFRRRLSGSPSGAMAPHVDTPDPATHAADQAATTGDRRDLLRYLRLRRAK